VGHPRHPALHFTALCQAPRANQFPRDNQKYLHTSNSTHNIRYLNSWGQNATSICGSSSFSYSHFSLLSHMEERFSLSGIDYSSRQSLITLFHHRPQCLSHNEYFIINKIMNINNTVTQLSCSTRGPSVYGLYICPHTIRDIILLPSILPIHKKWQTTLGH